MKTLVWLLRGILFIALFGLAVKNDRAVDLRFYFDNTWQAPLSLVVLAAFAAGALVGLSVAFATLATQWRDRLRGKREAVKEA